MSEKQSFLFIASDADKLCKSILEIAFTFG